MAGSYPQHGLIFVYGVIELVTARCKACKWMCACKGSSES